MDETKPTRTGFKLLKLLIAILVPIIVLLLLAALFLKLSGLDPLQEAENLLFRNNTPSTQSASEGTSQTQTAQLKSELSDQKATIKQLENDKNKLSDQVAELKNQLEQAQNEADKSSSQAATDRQAVYAQTYKSMDPEKAAAIFDKLSVKQAAEYINYLDDKTKASIMENMDPAKAAQLTPLLKAKKTSSDTTSAASGSSASESVTTTP